MVFVLSTAVYQQTLSDTKQMDNGGAASHSSPVSSSLIQTVSAAVSPCPVLRKLLTFKVYKRRWFVLLLLSLLNCSNSTLWLTFAPVADQSAQYLAVTLEKINWLSLIYMVISIPIAFVSSWMLDTFGLRIMVILGSWLNMSGAVLRVLATVPGVDISYQYIIVMGGQVLCASAQPLIIFVPTKLAAVWFPDHQRATANMMASMSNPLGIVLANVISPNIVSTPAKIPLLMLVYAIPACIICLLSTVGIRSSTPPTPPSASALTSNSEQFFRGVKLLLKSKSYLILMACAGSNVAIFTCWSSFMQQILCVQGYTNSFTGICSALIVVFGVIGAGLFGVYTDKTKKFIDVLKINLSITSLMCIAASVVTLLPQQPIAVAAVFSLLGFFGFSCYPVILELSVECSYPIGEALTTGLIFVTGFQHGLGRTTHSGVLHLCPLLSHEIPQTGGRGKSHVAKPSNGLVTADNVQNNEGQPLNEIVIQRQTEVVP
uniref:Solute carrier family 49 member 3 n=1 Tax=Cynoglossus semilaevis TaxID=244447 RepID=A0A3P8VYC8_CYNSE